MKKILIIFTGGTIGSSFDGKYLSTDKSKGYKLLSLFEEKKKDIIDVEFEIIEPYTILSEMLSGQYLNILGKCISENIDKDYDGIIITHGTDTIQYSAAAISYHLGNIDIPVMIVSSNYILEDTRSNGLNNFIAAVRFIVGGCGRGIFVPYKNKDGIVYVHQGVRLLPHIPYSDELFSINNLFYGYYDKDGKFVKQLNALRESNNKQFNNSAYDKSIKIDNINYCLSLPVTDVSDILRVYPYPGIIYPNFDNADTKRLPKAVLLDTYHSGTFSTTSDTADFLSAAKKKNIPVFLTGANRDDDYESLKTLKNEDVIVLPTASPIAMYMKLWICISNYPDISIDELTDILITNYIDDIL